MWIQVHSTAPIFIFNDDEKTPLIIDTKNIFLIMSVVSVMIEAIYMDNNYEIEKAISLYQQASKMLTKKDKRYAYCQERIKILTNKK